MPASNRREKEDGMDAHVITKILRPPQSLIREMADFDPATVHEASGGKGALSSAIKPLDFRSSLCGPAITIACRPGDNLMLHKAIYVAEPGDVLVATVGEYAEAGPWGEIMAWAAQVRGVAGLIIDGSVRDAGAITKLQFPVFSRSLCIKGTTKECLGLINHPINIGGVTIRPGDLVLGDADGVVAVAREDVVDVLARSKARREKEEKVKEELKKGRSTLEIFGFDKILQAKGLKET
jgi:4-hydroxy-4-methyl-2-oxoglutarate aldolase